MNYKKLIKKEKRLWHEHFIPAIIAGLAVAILAYIYEMTLSNIILFASVGASAIILTNSKSHHLTNLKTTIYAYLAAIIISIITYYAIKTIHINLPLSMFLIVFLMGIVLFLIDAFHPPAITAAISFIVLDRTPKDLISLFLAIMILFVIVRLITYLFSQHLSLRKFKKEFQKNVV